MMGDHLQSLNRPRCCYCSTLAVGRICYVNSKHNIVDNPFCQTDFEKIYKETCDLLDELFGITSIMRDYLLVQRWKYLDAIPEMPVTAAMLMYKGANRRISV